MNGIKPNEGDAFAGLGSYHAVHIINYVIFPNMNEIQYIKRLKKIIPENGEVPIEAIELIDRAVGDLPMSARLWIMRGDLIQLGPIDSPYSLNDALSSYRKALEIEPKSIEAHDEIGHYYDSVMDDEAEAGKWYAKAEKLKKQR